MKHWIAAIAVSLLLLFQADATAQQGESPLRFFGYFQNSFAHWTEGLETPQRGFTMQQLNIMAQKDLAKNLTAFFNIEMVNSFSSSRQWGAVNLEEAWVRYRRNEQFSVRLGLQIPVFNNLNEIKNRTPILPYVVRPLVYESSFREISRIDDFVPQSAFLQVFGFLGEGDQKFDYAFYLGNSPDVNSDPFRGVTGIDTTSAMLIGGRIGVRDGELKLGVSGTFDQINFFGIFSDTLRVPRNQLEKTPRFRLGADLSLYFRGAYLEAEGIMVMHDPSDTRVEVEERFYYITAGYYLTERLFLYGSYWYTLEQIRIIETQGGDGSVPGVGFSYQVSDRLTVKAQYARPSFRDRFHHGGELTSDVVHIAASVFF